MFFTQFSTAALPKKEKEKIQQWSNSNFSCSLAILGLFMFKHFKKSRFIQVQIPVSASKVPPILTGKFFFFFKKSQHVMRWTNRKVVLENQGLPCIWWRDKASCNIFSKCKRISFWWVQRREINCSPLFYIVWNNKDEILDFVKKADSIANL